MKEGFFRTGVAYLQKIYGKKIDDEVYKNYWDILKDYTDEEFKKMLEGIVKTFIPTSQVPFPLIPHFLEAVGDTGKTRAQLAVMAVKSAIAKNGPYQSISFGDRALHETIKQFGGWIELCEWDQDKWQFNEKRFLLIYDAACHSGQGSDRLIGIHERENIGKDTADYTEEQKRFVDTQKRPVEIEWKGFKQLAHKPELKRIEAPEAIAGILKNLLS